MLHQRILTHKQQHDAYTHNIKHFFLFFTIKTKKEQAMNLS